MNLDPFFAPKSIVIIGASRKFLTFNSTLVKNLRESRYKGDLYIIHPKADDILGIKSYQNLSDLPKVPELAIVLRSKQIENTIETLGALGINHCMIECDLSFEPNYQKIRSNIQNIAEKYQMLIIGPAMIGIINIDNFFTSSIIPVRRHILQSHKKLKNNGSLSFLAQSGGLSGALGWWNPQQNIPISKVVHTGASINVSDGQMLQYLFNDKQTKVISLYLKDNKPDVIQTLKNNFGKKPVLYKYVGKDSEYNEKLKAFATEVINYIELFEFAKVFLWCPEPEGNSLGIVGPSSGAIHLLIAEMRKTDLHLARLKNDTRKMILDKVGGSTCLAGNPIDYWPPKKFVGTDVCKIYYNSSNLLLKDETVDALFLALEFFSEIEFDFDIFKRVLEKYHDKPIIVILIQAEKEGVKRIIESASELNIPVFVDEIERAIRAYSALIRYHQAKTKSK